jgi:hypothetical protein
MKKSYIAGGFVFVLATLALLAAESNKIPADIGVRIRTNQLDQSRLQNQMTQIQSQYFADQQAIQHDQTELDSLDKEALAAAKLDPATNSVDNDKLEFVTKAAPPKPVQPEVKK